LGPLLFIININDLLLEINTCSKPVLVTDDTNLLITANNLSDFQIKSMSVLNHMSKRFAVNGSFLNIGKTNVIPKGSSACYVIRLMYHFSNINTLKMIYFAYFHSRMK
jgi:hypothetical protein